ncbi:MAG: hypothetical protein ACRD2A_00660 [Vicinamibacterales bacterium]
MLAMAASAVGDQDQAIEFAQQASDQREPVLIILARVWPHYRRLREDPRFSDVIRRLAFPR